MLQVVDVGHMEPHLDLNAPGGYEEAYAAQQAAYAAAQQQAMADPAQPMKTCRRCCVRTPPPLLCCRFRTDAVHVRHGGSALPTPRRSLLN